MDSNIIAALARRTHQAGGFDERVEAAAAAGAKLIVIGRAQEETGAGYSEIVDYLKQHFAAGN